MNKNGPCGGGRRLPKPGGCPAEANGCPGCSADIDPPDTTGIGGAASCGKDASCGGSADMPHSNPIAAELTSGRIFLGALCRESDLLRFLHRFCIERKIRAGLFSLTGSTRSATVGIYDPSQQVYATRRVAGAFDIVFCTGTILPGGDETVITAQVLLCGENRDVSCGRLFSETSVDAGEFEIRELVGPAPNRIFDPVAARMGLQFLESTHRARGDRTPEAGSLPKSPPPRQK